MALQHFCVQTMVWACGCQAIATGTVFSLVLHAILYMSVYEGKKTLRHGHKNIYTVADDINCVFYVD